MNPLSVFTYYLHNKRKVGPLIGIIVLAVLAIASPAATTGSLMSTARKERVFYDAYSVIRASGQTGLSDTLVDSIRSHQGVTSVILVQTRFIRTEGLFGSDDAPIFFLSEGDIEDVFNALTLEIKAGRLPRPNTNEVALTNDIVLNKGKGLGDDVGSDVDKEDVLPGRWRIVGILTGNVRGGIGSKEYLLDHYDTLEGVTGRPYTLAVAARETMEEETASFLESLRSVTVNVDTVESVNERLDEEFASLDSTLWVLNGIAIVVITLAVVLLNIIFFMQRANEFGLLAAIGYSRGFLIRKTALEAFVAIALGWGIGILAS